MCADKKPSTSVRTGIVTEVDRHNLLIHVSDVETRSDLQFHWTSFWSAYPGEVLRAGDVVELIVSAPRYLAVRKPLKVAQRGWIGV